MCVCVCVCVYIYIYMCVCVTFRTSLIAQLIKNPLAVQETLVQFLGQENVLEKG